MPLLNESYATADCAGWPKRLRPMSASTASSRTRSCWPRSARTRSLRSSFAVAGARSRHVAMNLVLDSGALIALERNDRPMWRRLKSAFRAGVVAVTHGGVVGQAWRGDGSRQARLAQALENADVRPLDEALGRASGALLAATGQRDVIDAALVLLAHDGDRIFTSDREDIAELAAATGRHVEIIRV